MPLINIGVHKLESYKNNTGIFENSYFIHRSYLNYLIFSPQNIEMFYDYFESKGGIGKQIFTDKNQINGGASKIFNRYGASAVIAKKDYPIADKTLKTECFGEEFFDKDITFPWESPDKLSWLVINQRGKKFLITDEHIILTTEGWRPNPQMTFDESKIKHINDILGQEIDYLLPRYHEGDFFLQKLNKRVIEDSLNIFHKRL